MEISDILKEFENDLIKKKSGNYRLGINYALGMLDKHLKNKTDCWFYGTDVYCCKNCEYICERYQKK